MPTIVTGSQRSDQLLAAKVKVMMREKIDMLDSERFIFEYLSRQFRGMVNSTNTKYEFIEQRIHPLVMTVTAVNAPGTAVSVDHAEYAHADQLIYNTRTLEWYLMTADGVAGGDLAVVNQQAGSGNFVTATAVGDILQIGPEAHAEGEAIPTAWAVQPTNLFTYIFQHDRTRGNTDIQKATGEYGEKQLLIDRKLFWVEEMRALNMQLYIAEQTREIVSAAPRRRHSMQGLRNWINTNYVDFNAVVGNLTLASVGELMRRTMMHGASSATKVGIAGQNAVSAISAMPVSAIRTTVSETAWGKNLKTLVTPYGNLSFGYDQMLSAEFGMADIFAILDPAYIERLQISGLETHLLLNVQDSVDIHNQTDVITGTDGLRVGLEELHAWGFNIK
jgi:hypothetical protein